jgi:aquaporin Z
MNNHPDRVMCLLPSCGTFALSGPPGRSREPGDVQFGGTDSYGGAVQMAAETFSPEPDMPTQGVIARYEKTVIERITDFNDPHQEWRRLFSELFGTFLLVLVAAGGGMMSHAFPGVISRTDAVVAPGLMVMGVILFMGKVSGAHLNPAVSIAFALREDFPWRRVPGYIVVQLAGAALAALFLHSVLNVSASYGSNYPSAAYSSGASFWMEFILTMGLVSVILGTASGAQNVGLFGAIGVAGYIALAGLWGSPISGASMNPARTFGPDLISGNFGHYLIYVTGPIAGAVVAVGIAFVLRGRGGGSAGSGAGQGALFTEIHEIEQAHSASRERKRNAAGE